MSSYGGRTGPNFSQFLNNLNTVSPTYDNEMLPSDDINLDQELAMFTNTDFTDFDNMDSLPGHSELSFELKNAPTPSGEMQSEMKYEELLTGDPGPFMLNFGAPIQPAPQQPPYAQPSNVMLPSESSPSLQAPAKQPALKRKSDTAPISVEEQTRLAAEEDKRRRNTAASARFRVKKKQREQALEKTVKDVNDKNTMLQSKVDQLEMENKWLKNLIMEKNGSQTEKDIADLYQKFRRESEERESSRDPEHTDGVGTK